MSKTSYVATLYVATTNQHKLTEIADLLAPNGFEVRSARELGDITVVEDGDTFLANARKKIVPYLALTNQWVLADDSGLEVPILGGDPGVHSARYARSPDDAGPPDDAANNAKLLRKLAAYEGDDRQGRFVCAIVLGHDGKEVFATRGCAEGMLLTAPRGAGGFGYDPLFLYPEEGRTFAELPAAVKNRVSHRGRALRAVTTFLEGTVLEDQTRNGPGPEKPASEQP